MAEPSLAQPPPVDDGRRLAASVERFDLAAGGPFNALERRLGLLRETAAAAPRRALILVGLTFGVPLALSLAAGHAWGPLALRPLLLDWGAWARFVLSVAVFVLMERMVEERLKVQLRQFAATPLLAPSALAAAAGSVDRALRRRDLSLAEFVCIVLAYVLTLAGTWLLLGGQTDSWLVQGAPEAARLTAAGWWTVLVSSPLFWFLLLRWLWRHLVWALLLRELSKLELRLVVTHPDGLGGLAFIGQYPNAFAALVFAMSCVLAAAIAKAFQHDALELDSYGYVMGAWLIVVLLLFGVPLLTFTPPLGRLKQQALLASSAAATRHFRAAERATLGSNLAAATDADAVAVAEIPNPTPTYTAAKKLGTMAFSREALLPVAGAALLPLVLAGATRLPFADLWKIAKKLLLL